MAGIDEYAKLLLHMDGADASTTFTDASASPKTMTAVGDAQIDTAQYVFGGASGLFDGTGDWLTTPSTGDFAMGTGDFTVDFRVRFNNIGSNRWIQNQDTSNQLDVGWDSASLWWRFFVGGTEYNFSWTPTVNTWYHVAFTRENGSLRCFIDGAQVGTTKSATGSVGAGFLYIGTNNGGFANLNGWLDEYRVTKGLARWVANFTPPTASYSADGIYGIDVYTRLLAHFDNNLTDSSFYARTITSTGAGSTRSAVQSKFGGYSQKFDGTTAYLSFPNTTLYDFSGDFTIDCWIYTGDKSLDTQYREIWNNGTSSASANWMGLTINNSTGGLYFITADTVRITGTTDVSNSAWHHVAISRTGSSIKLFVDGVQDGSTYTSSQDFKRTTGSFYLGIYADTLTTGRWNGYIDEFRISCGIGRYTGTFSVPTAAYTESNTIYQPSWAKGNFTQPDCSRRILM